MSQSESYRLIEDYMIRSNFSIEMLDNLFSEIEGISPKISKIIKKIIWFVFIMVVLAIISWLIDKGIEYIEDFVHFVYCDFDENNDFIIINSQVYSYYMSNYRKMLSTITNQDLEKELNKIEMCLDEFFKEEVKGCRKCITKAIDNLKNKRLQINLEIKNRKFKDYNWNSKHNLTESLGFG